VYTIKCPEAVDELEPPPEEPLPSGGTNAKIRRIQRSAVPERR
jgi:hypothetical protein